MKKTFESITAFAKKDLVFVITMAVVCFFYRINMSVDILLIGILFLLLLANIKDNKLFYAYFALIFFEPILVLPIIGGTFFRIFYLLLALRVVLDYIDKRKIKKDIPTIVVGAIFFVTSFIYSISLARNFSVVMNVLSVLYISLSLKASVDYKKELGRLLTFIAVFSVLSGFFGLIRGFMLGGLEHIRFFGTIDDPNYSALFYIIGFFASFGASMIKKKWVKIGLQVLLFLFILSTASVSGLLIVLFLSFIWFYVAYGFKKTIIIVLVGVFLLIAILFIPFADSGFLGMTQDKLHRFMVIENPYPDLNYQYPNYSDLELYINRITSNRYYLAKTYAIHLFVNTPITQQLFGGNNPVEGGFRENVPVRNAFASHNTYLDMMFMMGYIFMLLLLVFIGINIVRHFRRYLKDKETGYVCLVLIMLSVLMFSTVISIFPYRYFIAFLLL
jgi:hypothetical protein